MDYSDIRYLEVPLPEEIEKLKWHGDFARAERVIARMLATALPEALRKRLLLEREILRRLPSHYPFDWEETLARFQEKFPDFTEEALEALWEDGGAEWIYVDGQVHFHELVVSNYLKSQAELALGARLCRKVPPALEARIARAEREAEQLNAAVARMKREGGAACRLRIRAELRVASEAERPGSPVRVELPIPVEYAQVRNFCLRAVEITASGQRLRIEGERVTVAPSDALQRTVSIETVYRPGMRFSVEYSLENATRFVQPDAAKTAACQPNFYTQEQSPHLRFTPYLKALTAEVTGDVQNPLARARRIYDFITGSVRYSFMRAYATIGDLAQYPAAGLKSDCGIQSLLFIAMCRIAGIPARWQSGQYALPGEFGSHDWAQFYVAPFGWLYADCSLGGDALRAGDRARWDFYFGNVDPYRIPLAAEFQQDFYRPSPCLRNDPYDNQVGEVFFDFDGEAPCALHHHEFDTVYTVQEFAELPWS